MVCPVFLKSFYLSGGLRDFEFCFDFLLQFSFKYDKGFRQHETRQLQWSASLTVYPEITAYEKFVLPNMSKEVGC